MTVRFLATTIAALSLLLTLQLAGAADSPEDATVAAVRKSAEQLVQTFNAGKADEVAAKFLPKGELIDEEGTAYQGTTEIKNLLTSFYGRFPGAKLTTNIESIRPIGPLAIEEGTRTITTKDGATRSQFRYIGVWAKGDKGWQLASFRDFSDDPPPTPNESLQPLAWLVGDWVNEGEDGKVAISYRWSEDKNFLLGEFQINSADGAPRKSSQRLGWDPAAGKIRSWLFDSDGGFAEGIWTLANDGIVVKASSVNPSGETATATLNITPKDKDHFSIEGTDRIVGDNIEEDFAITVTRRPPAAGK